MDGAAALMADQLKINCVVAGSLPAPGDKAPPSRRISHQNRPLAAVLDDVTAQFGCTWEEEAGVYVFRQRPPESAAPGFAAAVTEARARLQPPALDVMLGVSNTLNGLTDAAREIKPGLNAIPLEALPEEEQAVIWEALGAHFARRIGDGWERVQSCESKVAAASQARIGDFAANARLLATGDITQGSLRLWIPPGKPGFPGRNWSWVTRFSTGRAR